MLKEIPTPEKRTIPAWLPEDIRAQLVGFRFQLDRLPETVRRRMRTPERIGVTDHARRFRIVTEPPHTGPWRKELAPHTVKLMELFAQPWLREIWFCGVDQSGKTNTLLNCLHWAIDIAPGDVFYLMPTQETSNKIVTSKLIPMLQESRRVKKYLSKRADDTGLSAIRLRHGVTIRPAWANSPSSMATFPARYCFGDEIDKFPDRAGREADPLTLIKKRNRLYDGRYKRFFASTPAQRFIYKNTMNCVQIWEEHHRCPHCGGLFRPEGGGLVIPEGLKAEDITEETEVFYTCTCCGVLLSDTDRLALLANPVWVCIKGEELMRPSRVGFFHRAWDCMDVLLHEIAAGWLASLQGGVNEKVAWANGFEAMDYTFEAQDRKEDFILRLKDDSQPRGIVPADLSYLMIIADTQQVGFYYKILAFGWGESVPVTMIAHGYVASFNHLHALATQEWLNACGESYRCQSGWIDSGGGTDPNHPRHSRTVEVYRFCRANPLWRPLKGRRSMEQPWNVKRLDFYPSSAGQKIPIPGGLNLYTLNTSLFKDELAGKLQIEPGDPGAITLHAETTSDYAAQLCAEYRDDRGWWICPKGKDNHQWDCWVYALAAAEIIGIRDFRKERQAETYKVYSKGVQRA